MFSLYVFVCIFVCACVRKHQFNKHTAPKYTKITTEQNLVSKLFRSFSRIRYIVITQ